MDKDFKIGDVVMLNSGGPWMTVVAFEGATLYRCSWASDNGDFTAIFDGACLRKKEEKND